MATAKDTSTFFLEADTKQFQSVLDLYPQAIKLKAEQKTKKPEELIKLDNWWVKHFLGRKCGRGVSMNLYCMCTRANWFDSYLPRGVHL